MSSFYQGKKRYSKKEWRERNLQAYYDEKEYRKEELKKGLTETAERDIITRALLDSSLISTTVTQNYTHKIIQCGDYYQVYNYYDKKVKKEKGRERMDKNVNICNIDTDDLQTIKNGSPEIKTIEAKNIQRSKLSMQRLVKSNENIFKTFITLTFAENIKDIEVANKKFKNFRDSLSRFLKRQKKEFSYVCVPEFQKRGAVHYHLLTNLDIKENSDVIIPQKDKKNQYDVKYWTNGFSSVYPMDNINVVGYLTKYMTKDIDNRLWGKRRYLYSLNLIHPSTVYIDIDDLNDNSRLSFIELFSDLKYSNMYADSLGQVIEFREYKRKEYD